MYDLHHLHAPQTFSDPSCSVIEARLESFLPRSEFSWKTVFGSQNVNFFFSFSFFKLWTAKDERQHLACCQHAVKKPASVMV